MSSTTLTPIDELLANVKITLINSSGSKNQEKKNKKIIYELEQKINEIKNEVYQNKNKCSQLSEQVIEQKKQLFEQSNKLSSQEEQLSEQKRQMEKYSDIIKIKSEKEAYKVMDKIRDIGTDFVSKISICRCLLRYMKKHLNITGGIVGSFVRQMMELPFLMKDIYRINDDDTINFGNPIDHDVDIVLVKEPHNKELIRYKIINAMNSINSELGKLKFGDYIVNEIVDVTITSVSQSDPIGKQNLLNVPHYQIRLDESDTDIDNLDSNIVIVLDDGPEDQHNTVHKSIIIDVIGWYPEQDKNYYNPYLKNCNITPEMWPVIDFDVNALMMEKNGFHIKNMSGKNNSVDLFDIFENIEKRRARCLIDLQGLHQEMVRVSDMTSKLICLKQLSFFIGNRMKILSNGYNKVIGNIPDYGIEQKEECPVTHCSPPYLVYKLECGHDFSSVALMSSVQKNLGENFNFMCYKCSKDFKLTFIESNKIPDTISINLGTPMEKSKELSDNGSDDELPALENPKKYDDTDFTDIFESDDDLPPLEDESYEQQKVKDYRQLYPDNKKLAEKIIEQVAKESTNESTNASTKKYIRRRYKPVSTVGTDRSKLKPKPIKGAPLQQDPSYS